jgi:hypothetical protein
MENKLPREFFWVNKTTMGDFLKEPLNKKLYEVYLSIKRKTPSQDFQTLKLFNEVYYQCSRIIVENNSELELCDIINDIKANLGWNFSTSIVVNMIYAILALRRNNTTEVNSFLERIVSHYKLEQYKTPFYMMTESCKANGDSYVFEPHITQDEILQAIKIPIDIQTFKKNDGIHITVNMNNQFTGEIKSINVNSPGNIVGKEIKI